MKDTPIPAGYRQNAQGHLVAEHLIRQIDLLRDAVVLEIVEKAKPVAEQVSNFRLDAFADTAAFVSLSAEEYDVHIGGKKGNVTLTSFDGRYKVLRAIADIITFDERLQAAKKLIDECLAEWTEGAKAEVQVLVQDAFRIDKAGNIRTGRILELRRLKITDERWVRAMTAIGESLQVVGTKPYIRVYERDADTGAYRAIGPDWTGA